MKDSTQINEVYHADCLDFLRSYTGPKIDLIYLDPPYFLEREFKLDAREQHTSFKKGWSDSDHDARMSQIIGSSTHPNMVNYLSWLHSRLEIAAEHLSDTGSIFLHIGSREAPYVGLLMDHVFGFKNWRSTITWQRSHPHNNMTKSLGNVSDMIFYYTKSNAFTFNLLYTAHDEKYLSNSFNNKDDVGNYALAPIIQERSRAGHFYSFNNFVPPNGWRVREPELIRLSKLGYIHWGTNRPYKKVYLHESQGALLQNIWSDIHNITRTELDKRHYPTQKPLALLERIISLASEPGDLVFDPFAGSGTTCVAAKKLGRSWLGCDISSDAIKVANHRLSLLDQDLTGESTLF